MAFATPITVIGAGAWGGALAILLARNGNPVRLWGKDQEELAVIKKTRASRYLAEAKFPESIEICFDLAKSLEGVRDILIVVPSHAFRDVLQHIKPFVTDSTRIVSGTKGLDPQTKKCMHELVAEFFSEDMPVAVIAGPSFAKEVVANLPTAVSLAGNNAVFIHSLIDRLHNDRFRVYENKDLLGVELCGVVKNVLAIAVGIADGMQLGANTRCALITRGLAEMGRFCVGLGAQKDTSMGLAGVGDLVLTCTDNQSRNRRFGIAIGQGVSSQTALQQVGGVVEGFFNAEQVYQLAQAHHIEMPISRSVYGVLHQGLSPLKVVSELLERSPKVEN